MSDELLNELIEIAREVSPETTLERLSLDEQKQAEAFFRVLAEGLTEFTKEKVIGVIAQAFCAGHEWATRHWSLWKNEG